MEDETENLLPDKTPAVSKLAKAKKFAKTLNSLDIFRIVVFVLHFLAACGFVMVSFVCDVKGISQQGTYDAVEEGYPDCEGDMKAQCFRAGVPWVDDAELDKHMWNPYEMIFVFEWISAGFALFYLRRALPWVGRYYLCLAWDGLGIVAIVFWHVRTSVNGWGQAMLCIFSLWVCGLVHLGWDNEIGELLMELEAEKKVQTGTQLTVVAGRLWKIPARLGKPLKQTVKSRPRSVFRYVGEAAADESEQSEEAQEEKELDSKKEDGYEWSAVNLRAQLEILLRYIEYSLSAPLLFIAILCMVVVDAPVWMYMGGYALVQACNLQGIPLHLMCMLLEDGPRIGAVTSRNTTADTSSWIERNVHTLAGFLGVGHWRDLWVNQLCHLQGAWISLSMALLIILYVARDVFFSDVVPMQIKFLLWWLIVSYGSFGLVASVVYGFHVGRKNLDVYFDVLSLLAKFPTPCVVALNYFLKPAGSHPCF
jgi:hypothetical protein